MINKHFKLHTLITYFSHSIIILCGFVLMYIINKYAGLQVYGELAIIISTAGVIASLLSARSGEAVTRFYIREKTKQNISDAKLVIVLGLGVDTIIGIVVFFFFYALSQTIATFFLGKIELSFVIQMYGLITLSMMIRSSINGYFQANEYFKVINFIQVSESILKVLFIIIAFFVFGHKDISYIVYSYIFASFFVTIFAFVLFFDRFFKEFRGVNISKNTTLIKEYFVFNAKTFLSTILRAGNNNVDNLILGYFADAKTVGVYQILKNILAPLRFVATPYAMMTTSKLTKYFELKNFVDFKYLIKIITKNIILVATLISIVLYMILPYILDVMNITNSFKNPSFDFDILFVMMSINVILQISLWYSKPYCIITNPMISVYTSLFALLYNLFVCTSLTYFYGIYGLVFGTILLYFIMNVYFISKVATVQNYSTKIQKVKND